MKSPNILLIQKKPKITLHGNIIIAQITCLTHTYFSENNNLAEARYNKDVTRVVQLSEKTSTLPQRALQLYS